MHLHIGLRVRDVTRSTTFYAAFFGREPDKLRDGYARFTLDEPALVVGLTEDQSLPAAAPDRTHHFGLRLADPDAVAAAGDRLTAAGLATTPEEDTICCWARQEKLWLHDPDGHPWEVYCVVDDAPPVAARPACCVPTAGRP